MMSRPIVLVFAVALLVVALASPLAVPVGLLSEPIAAIPAPARLAASRAPSRGAPTPPQDALVAVLTFRGPPAGGFFLVSDTENPDPEERWNARGALSRRSRCT